MQLKLVSFEDSIRRPCSAVKAPRAHWKLAVELFRVMRENHGIGLAAAQVGVPLRFFVALVGGRPYAVCNPVVEPLTKATQEDVEGCLSLPGRLFKVKRPLAVKLRGVDVSGEPIDLSAAGYLARVLAHEADHCNNVCICHHGTELKAPEPIASPK